MRIFLDANIFFAAARSPEGGSGFILELAKKKKLEPNYPGINSLVGIKTN